MLDQEVIAIWICKGQKYSVIVTGRKPTCCKCSETGDLTCLEMKPSQIPSQND